MREGRGGDENVWIKFGPILDEILDTLEHEMLKCWR